MFFRQSGGNLFISHCRWKSPRLWLWVGRRWGGPGDYRTSSSPVDSAETAAPLYEASTAVRVSWEPTTRHRRTFWRTVTLPDKTSPRLDKRTSICPIWLSSHLHIRLRTASSEVESPAQSNNDNWLHYTLANLAIPCTCRCRIIECVWNSLSPIL